MKKLLALFLALFVLSLAACGAAGAAAPETAAAEEAASVRGLPAAEETGEPAETVLDPSDLDLDLSVCEPDEVYREIEHLNIDPSGYVGLRLRVTGELYRFVSHGRTFYYIAARNDDGAENLELRFPGDGSAPEDLPEDGTRITVWGRLGNYAAGQDGRERLVAVLTDVQFSTQTDFRD